jgi:hypothetical protein
MYVDKQISEITEDLSTGWSSGTRYCTAITLSDIQAIPGTGLSPRVIEPPTAFRFLLEITETFAAAATEQVSINLFGSNVNPSRIEQFLMTKARAHTQFTAGKWIDFGVVAGNIYETVTFALKTQSGNNLTDGTIVIHVLDGMSTTLDSPLSILEAFN